MRNSLAKICKCLLQRSGDACQNGEVIVLSQARHPVAERIVPHFQANDLFLGPMSRFRVITGPNRAGKSTYLRQAVLNVIMAHMGSYVPAEFCTTKPFKRIFTRIGTEDDIEASASTFTVEMREVAFILENVDEESLVIIDELGRGTSNLDGAAIAWAISEELVRKHAYVLFATHFHEITEISQVYEQIHNSHLRTASRMPDGEETVSHTVSDGFVRSSAQHTSLFGRP